jgi:hypothetical protein
MLANAWREQPVQTCTATCTATCIDGRPCTTRARPGRTSCFAHDPALREKRDAARQAGGRGKATVRRIARRMPATLTPVLDRLYNTLAALDTGACDARTATAMATVGTAIARLYDQAATEPRLQALEAAAAADAAPTQWVARREEGQP